MFRNIAQASTVRVDVAVFCHGEDGVSSRQLRMGVAAVSCKDVQGAGEVIKKQRREASHGGLCATRKNQERVTKAFLVEVTWPGSMSMLWEGTGPFRRSETKGQTR